MPFDSTIAQGASNAPGEATGAAADRLREYTLAKQRVAVLVRSAKQLLHERGDASGSAEAQQLLVKLAEDRFNLAVVGQFKRGKSSLMNAIVGQSVLPTGVLPLTSAITSLSYGPEARAFLRRKGWHLEQEISLGVLPEYVTERGNPGNVKELIEVRIELPAAFLRRGLHFVDTPGIGSSRADNTATTMAFLPEADAVVFVTSVDAPFSQVEAELLAQANSGHRRVLLAVNKMDLLPPEERHDVLAYVRSAAGRVLAPEAADLYPVSARQALAARLSGDTESLRKSGLPAIEQALANFLGRAKGQVFLTTVLERALRLLPAGDPEALAIAGAISRLRGELETGNLEAAGQEQGEVKVRWNPPEVLAKAEFAGTGRRAWVMSTSTCPVCAYQSQVLFDFFVQMQHDLATSEIARARVAREGGLCQRHTWQFERIASPQGFSEGYASLIEAHAQRLRLFADSKGAPAISPVLLPSEAECPACSVLRRAEQDALALLRSDLAHAQGQARYERSAGCCLAHMQSALASWSGAEAHYLLQMQVHHLEELAEDMRSYTLKRDALRRNLANDEEEGAWRRALVQLAGEPTAKPWLPGAGDGCR